MEVIFLDRAKENIGEIFQYIFSESGSERAAEDFTVCLVGKCYEIANQPFKLGQLRPEFGKDLRSYVFRKYIIFFRYSDEKMEIVAFIEGHRDMAALFN